MAHSQIHTSDPAGHGVSSRCIEPYGFEQLMHPIDLAIDQRADTRVRSTLPLDSVDSPQISTTPDDSNKNSEVDCECDRVLDAMQCRLPLRRHADSLVAIFFSRHQRMLPVLHESTFMKQYHALWESTYTISRQNTQKLPSCLGLCKQKSKGTLFPATLNVVFSLGALFASRDAERNSEQAREYFRLAESIDILQALDGEVGIELVQLALLMGFYLQSTERFSKCWNIGGLAIRMAQNMGLHFSISEACKRGLLSPRSTQLDCEMRPLLVSASGKFLKLPEPIDDQLLSNEVGNPKVQPKDFHSPMEYYTETAKLYKILGQVLEKQEPELISDSFSTTQSILGLDVKIMEWQSNLPRHLKQEPLPVDMDFSDDHISEFFLPESLGILDFPALARRLHCRFLHTRILILRPALESLFQKQQRQKPDVVFGLPKTGILQDSLVRSIAAQCVLLAIDLVNYLATQIRTETFLCWWYNISFLHVCGSALLMGRLCTFDKGEIPLGSLCRSWTLCLQHLSNYEKLSKIARKSSYLLQESAKRLIGPQDLQVREDDDEALLDEPFHHDSTQTIRSYMATNLFGFEHSSHPVTLASQLDTTPAVAKNVSSQSRQDPENTSAPSFTFGQDEIGHAFSDLTGHDLWDSTLDGYSSWPLMPPISQLVMLPLQFDGSNNLS
ncbi:uncharacterized protein A1O9_10601 [Exophiala aquamarina CBS 119918]|uniref:Xylanolytic transcriptional activator regulatory domain-containing protein n=1 Tax=Exophiala aquamarina CBS 119918 TaxID=1182545 RepID=A0A072P1K4_9EURO|nr:uncharacterized protein A1O9_10601 [Exophiala aquamarina CBS 119918]KEF53153.1 hypothetical protein A1O9_10601 [Exophiala aquamarina CBS 119918]